MSVFRQGAALAMLGGLIALGLRSVWRVQAERHSSRPRADPEHLQTWEGEGGGVPVDRHRTAAQVRPS